MVFVDESSTSVAMTLLHARAPRGERAYGSVPRRRGSNVSLIAALDRDGLAAAMTLVGPVDRLAFEVYVERVLAPSLSPGQVVVMDNLAAHKGERVRELVEAKGCEVLFLPPHSPDFSPIEEAFSKLKARLRKEEKARTKEALVEAIGRALDAITAGDARGWFAHCGYPAQSL